MRKKSTRILSILIAIAMIFTLIPFGVMAASNSGPAKASESTLGRADGDYQLTIVNDADVPMLYDVQVDGKSERLTFGAGEALSVGVNDGDAFKVDKVGNSNYKVDAQSSTFQSGDYTADIQNSFAYTVGAGFKVGEEHVYNYNDGSAYEGEVKTVNGKTVVADTAKTGTVTLTTTSSKGTVTLDVNGAKTSSDVSGNFSTSGSGAINSASAANTKASQLQNAADALWNTAIAGLSIDSTYETAKATITATYSNGLFGIGRSVSFKANGDYQVYQPLTDKIIDIFDEVPANDITLTYTTETQAKAGNLSLNVLNGERLDALHNTLTIETVTSLMSMLTGGDASAGAGMSMDAMAGLLGNPDLMSLIGIEATDNMPKGYKVTLTEVDKNDGLYEGLSYEIPMTNTMFIDINLRQMMQDALGNTLFGMAQAAIPAEMLAIEMTLPVSIGQTFAEEGIRAGQYTLSITSPGEGWYAADKDTYDVTITDGGTVNNIGGNHIYGNIRTASMIDPMANAMGVQLGCLGGLASLMLGNNSVKFVNTNGVVFNHALNHIEFTNAMLNVDDASGRVQTLGIPGATFMLIDRDRFSALVDSLLGLGGAVINSVIGGISFDELLGLRNELDDPEGDAEVEAEPGLIDKILVSVIALGDRLDGIQVPAMLEAVADENGVVTFGPENNVTLQKLIDLIPLLTGAVENIGNITGQIGSILPSLPGSGGTTEPADGEEPAEGEEPATPAAGGSALANLGGMDMGTILELLNAIADPDQIGALMGMLDGLGGMNLGGGGSTEPSTPAEPTEPTEPTDPAEPAEPGEPAPDMMQILMNLLQDYGGGDLGYAMLNFIGLSDGRFPTSNYLLLQTKVPEGRVRNPMMYVFNNTWDAEKREYHTYAGIDLAGIMSNEAFATFAGQLEQSYVLLEKIFGNLANTADGGLSVARAFIGEEGEGYNSQALFDMFDDISRRITAAYENQQNPDAENPSQGIPLISAGLKQGLSFILDTVLDTYIPKATVLTYVTNLIYNNTGRLFESREEVADLITTLAMDGDLTFTQFNGKIQQMLADADYVLNGEVTRNWYYYDVSPNIFTNINVVYHYVLNQMLPPELANVIERALQGYIDDGEAMIDELIDQIVNPDQGEVEVPDDPDAPDLPATPSGPFGGLFSFLNGFSNFFNGIGNFFKNIFRW